MNWYDMNLRMYDPALARWMVQDPVIHYTKSTYNAFDNNPVYFADPSGAAAEGSNDGNSGGIESVQLGFGVTLANVAGVGLIESTAAQGYGGGNAGFYVPQERGTEIGQKYTDDDGSWIWDGTSWVGQNGTPDYVILDNDNVITPNKLDKSDVYFTVPIPKEWTIPRPMFPTVTLNPYILGPIGMMFVLKGDKPRDRIVEASDSSKNEKHGDGGRALNSAEKQIEALKEKLAKATGKEAKQIEQKIKNIRRTAEKNKKGTEHSNNKKR